MRAGVNKDGTRHTERRCITLADSSPATALRADQTVNERAVLARFRRLMLLENLRNQSNAKRVALGLCRCTLPAEDDRYRTLGGMQVDGVPWIVLQPCKALAPAECLKNFGSPNEGVDVMPAVALSLAHPPHEELLLQAAGDRPALQEARHYRRWRRGRR